MYQTISEAIQVSGFFKNNRFIPRQFKWKQQTFPIDRITGIHSLQRKGSEERRYAVISKGNFYLIQFIPLRESWKLLQIRCE